MSFFLTGGVVYHCGQCGATKTIKFKDGLHRLQIGVFNCQKQVELSKKYPSEIPYIHEDGLICSNCPSKYPENGKERDDAFHKLHIIIHEFPVKCYEVKWALKSHYMREISKIFKTAQFDDFLSDLIKSTVDNNKFDFMLEINELSPYVYDKLKDDLIDYFMNNVDRSAFERKEKYIRRMSNEYHARYDRALKIITDKKWPNEYMCVKDCTLQGKSNLSKSDPNCINSPELDKLITENSDLITSMWREFPFDKKYYEFPVFDLDFRDIIKNAINFTCFEWFVKGSIERELGKRFA